MVATRDKHRRIVSNHLESGETLHALINVNDGSPGAGPTSAVNATGRYRAEHGIEERGIGGIFDLFDMWLALTDRRLLVFRGSSFSLAPKPKRLEVALGRDDLEVAWRDDRAFGPFRLLHFTFANGDVVVRMGETDDESDRFLAALGERARVLDGGDDPSA